METELPAGYIRAVEAADILGVSVEDARTVLRFFAVTTRDGPQPLTAGGKPFGKAAKLYLKFDIDRIAGLKAGFAKDSN